MGHKSKKDNACARNRQRREHLEPPTTGPILSGLSTQRQVAAWSALTTSNASNAGDWMLAVQLQDVATLTLRGQEHGREFLLDSILHPVAYAGAWPPEGKQCGSRIASEA